MSHSHQNQCVTGSHWNRKSPLGIYFVARCILWHRRSSVQCHRRIPLHEWRNLHWGTRRVLHLLLSGRYAIKILPASNTFVLIPLCTLPNKYLSYFQVGLVMCVKCLLMNVLLHHVWMVAFVSIVTQTMLAPVPLVRCLLLRVDHKEGRYQLPYNLQVLSFKRCTVRTTVKSGVKKISMILSFRVLTKPVCAFLLFLTSATSKAHLVLIIQSPYLMKNL